MTKISKIKGLKQSEENLLNKQTNKSLAKSQKNRPALGSPPVSLPGHHHSLTQWHFLEVIVPGEPQEKPYPQSIG